MVKSFLVARNLAQKLLGVHSSANPDDLAALNSRCRYCCFNELYLSWETTSANRLAKIVFMPLLP